MFNVVLINPEIPPNTGNIGRLCCAVGAVLHLVQPLGFSLDDRQLKRAGLDYWEDLELVLWDGLETYLNATPPESIVLSSSKKGTLYCDIDYRPGDHILFGKETVGLPPELFDAYPARVARIPIDHTKVRSLNLSTAAGIIVMEAMRRTGQLVRFRDAPLEDPEPA